MKNLIICIFFFLLTFSSYAQINKSLSYEELQSQAMELLESGKIDSAIILMEFATLNFPEEEPWSSRTLAHVYIRSEDKTRALDLWEEGMEKGYNYLLTNPVYERYFEDNANFLRLRKQEALRLDTSHMKYELCLPTDYNPSVNYPLVFIFHGNNRNIERSKVSWESNVMKSEFIAVFLQSYIPVSNVNFVWRSVDAKQEKEFKEIYTNVLTHYPVDKSKIIFTGMSAGGNLALILAFNEFVPVSGLVLNCPVVPENLNDDQIERFIAKNRRIAIITGDNDFALENQKILVKKIAELGGDSRITINKDSGHEFVQDFSVLLDKYLSWIVE